jgi:hypothetical protein
MNNILFFVLLDNDEKRYCIFFALLIECIPGLPGFQSESADTGLRIRIVSASDPIRIRSQPPRRAVSWYLPYTVPALLASHPANTNI